MSIEQGSITSVAWTNSGADATLAAGLNQDGSPSARGGAADLRGRRAAPDEAVPALAFFRQTNFLSLGGRRCSAASWKADVIQHRCERADAPRTPGCAQAQTMVRLL